MGGSMIILLGLEEEVIVPEKEGHMENDVANIFSAKTLLKLELSSPTVLISGDLNPEK